MGRVLVVCDPGLDMTALSGALTAKGYAVVPTPLSEMDPQRLGPRDVVLTVGSEAVEHCEALVRRGPKCSVVVLDAAPSMPRAVAALRAGAADFVTNPADTDSIDAAIRRVLDKRLLSDRLGAPEDESDPASKDLFGESVTMRQVRSRLDRLKGSGATVLVTGERGTGKATVARILHDQGGRRDKPFVIVNCGAVTSLVPPEPGTTLFMKDIERLTPLAQAEFERMLERSSLGGLEPPSEVRLESRIIASSHADLAGEVAVGRFRERLYSLLSVVEIRLPPLRERGLDALILAQHFVRRFAAAAGKRVVGMTLGAARTLMEHDWPGNVRELSDCVEAAVESAHHDHITQGELFGAGAAQMTGERLEEDEALVSWNSLEARHIASILEEARGNKARAARLLGIDRKTLYRKLERYGLDAPERLRRAH